MYIKRRCIVLEDDLGKAWIVDGRLHREDGPAIECKNGNKAWFLNGRQYSKWEFENMQNNKPIESNNVSNFWDKLKGIFG